MHLYTVTRCAAGLPLRHCWAQRHLAELRQGQGTGAQRGLAGESADTATGTGTGRGRRRAVSFMPMMHCNGSSGPCSRRGQPRILAALATAPPAGGPPAAHPPLAGAGGERPPTREEEEEAPPRLSSRTGPRSNPAAAPPRPLPRRPPAGGGALPWQPCCARRGHPFPSLPFLRSPPFRPRHAASPPAHQPAGAGRHRSLSQAGMGRRPRPAPPRPRDRQARSGGALRAPRWAPDEAAGGAASGTGGTPALRGEHRLIPVKGPVGLPVAPRLRLAAQHGRSEPLGAPQPVRPLGTVSMSAVGDSRC